MLSVVRASLVIASVAIGTVHGQADYSDPERPLYLSGRVLDEAGNPVPGASVQIWQTDSLGLYDHPRFPDTADRDPLFQHYGTSTDEDGDGSFFFKTIVPAVYPQRPIRHIHYKVFDGDRNELLTSQWYFEDFNPNEQDSYLIKSVNNIVDNDGNPALTPDEITLVVSVPGVSGSLDTTLGLFEGPYYPGSVTWDRDNDLTELGDQDLSDEEVVVDEEEETGSLELESSKTKIKFSAASAPFSDVSATHCDRVILKLSSSDTTVYKMASKAAWDDCDFEGASLAKVKNSKSKLKSKKGSIMYIASGEECGSGVKVTINFVKSFASSSTLCGVDGETAIKVMNEEMSKTECETECATTKKCSSYVYESSTMACSLYEEILSGPVSGDDDVTCGRVQSCV